jgi:hypothetical protein
MQSSFIEPRATRTGRVGLLGPPRRPGGNWRRGYRVANDIGEQILSNVVKSPKNRHLRDEHGVFAPQSRAAIHRLFIAPLKLPFKFSDE